MRHASEPWWRHPRMDRLRKHFATASSVPEAGARVVGEDRPSVNSALLYFPLPRESALTESPIFALTLSRKPMALQNWVWSRLAGSGLSVTVGLHQSVKVSRGTPCSDEKHSDGAQQLWRFLRSVPLGTYFLATIGVIGSSGRSPDRIRAPTGVQNANYPPKIPTDPRGPDSWLLALCGVPCNTQPRPCRQATAAAPPAGGAPPCAAPPAATSS